MRPSCRQLPAYYGVAASILAVPATAMIWLAWRDGRRALTPILIGVLAAAAGLLICVLVYGDAFLSNLLDERQYELLRPLKGIGRLQWVLPALAIWAVWAWHARHTAVARFTALYIGVGLASYLIQWFGQSVLDNAQFDLLVATAVGIGLAYENVGSIRSAFRDWKPPAFAPGSSWCFSFGCWRPGVPSRR